jgi:hypothetical protein
VHLEKERRCMFFSVFFRKEEGMDKRKRDEIEAEAESSSSTSDESSSCGEERECTNDRFECEPIFAYTYTESCYRCKEELCEACVDNNTDNLRTMLCDKCRKKGKKENKNLN